MIMCTILKWNSKQIDFVQAFSQANIKHDMHMELNAGIVPTNSNKDFVLVFKKN